MGVNTETYILSPYMHLRFCSFELINELDMYLNASTLYRIRSNFQMTLFMKILKTKSIFQK